MIESFSTAKLQVKINTPNKFVYSVILFKAKNSSIKYKTLLNHECTRNFKSKGIAKPGYTGLLNCHF